MQSATVVLGVRESESATRSLTLAKTLTRIGSGRFSAAREGRSTLSHHRIRQFFTDEEKGMVGSKNFSLEPWQVEHWLFMSGLGAQ